MVKFIIITIIIIIIIIIIISISIKPAHHQQRHALIRTGVGQLLLELWVLLSDVSRLRCDV